MPRAWSGMLVLAVGTGCTPALKLPVNDAPRVLTRHTLRAPHPGLAGPHQVLTLFYGHGDDKNRPEYRDSVSVRTETVDASRLVSLGNSAESRNDYWGFTPKAFPLNGRVWYPDGEGPFPLVLVVHGNHNMRDFSDPGYDYLGELLASRGYILASIDMNFINGGIRNENDGRGWLLLKHVEAFAGFNDDPENPFHGKVDLDRIALIGHSRGGEAVGHAAAFNRLSRYPDNAEETFDFNYNIRSIIAIAPVDGQYLPTGRKVPVENVNYLVFHGSHDGDVTAFHGLRLYNRVTFTDETPRFKSAVYMYGANHGQWNTVWGSHDNGSRSGRILDLAALIDAEAQRDFARIYISAFLEATLRDDHQYLPIFRDHRVIGEWLPKTMYITRFQESSFRPVATFEEDIDLTTGTSPSVRLRGDSLSTWRENILPLRSRNRANTSASQENQAVWLGWNNRVAGRDTNELATPARYAIEIDPAFFGGNGPNADWSLDFVLAPTHTAPGPRRAPRDSTSADSTRADRNTDRRPARPDPDAEPPPIDVTVEIQDAAGRTARVALSRYGAIRRPLRMSILRRKDIEASRFSTRYELVLQSYSIPLSDFTDANGTVDLRSLAAIRFVFDRTVAGTVVVDDIGLSSMGSGWWTAR